MAANENETAAGLQNQPKRQPPFEAVQFDKEFDQRLKDLHANDSRMQNDEVFRKQQFDSLRAFINSGIPDDEAAERKAFHDILDEHEKEFQQAAQQSTGATPKAAGPESPQVKMETITQKLIRLLQEAQQSYYDNLEKKKAEKEARAAAAAEKAEDKEEAQQDAREAVAKKMEQEEAELEAIEDAEEQEEAEAAAEAAAAAAELKDEDTDQYNVQEFDPATLEELREALAEEKGLQTAPEPTPEGTIQEQTTLTEELTDLRKLREELEQARVKNDTDLENLGSPNAQGYEKLSAEHAQLVNQIKELDAKIDNLQVKQNAATPQPTPTPQAQTTLDVDTPPTTQAPPAPTAKAAQTSAEATAATQNQRSSITAAPQPQLKPQPTYAPTPKADAENVHQETSTKTQQLVSQSQPTPTNQPRPEPKPGLVNVEDLLNKLKGAIPSQFMEKFNQFFPNGPLAVQANTQNTQQNNLKQQNTAANANINDLGQGQNNANPNVMSLNQFNKNIDALKDAGALKPGQAQNAKDAVKARMDRATADTLNANAGANSLQTNPRVQASTQNRQASMNTNIDISAKEVANRKALDAAKAQKANQQSLQNQQAQTQTPTAKPF